MKRNRKELQNSANVSFQITCSNKIWICFAFLHTQCHQLLATSKKHSKVAHFNENENVLRITKDEACTHLVILEKNVEDFRVIFLYLELSEGAEVYLYC